MYASENGSITRSYRGDHEGFGGNNLVQSSDRFFNSYGACQKLAEC